MTDLSTPPALFRSTHDALRFAFKCDYELIGRSLMSRMADGPTRTGRGLGGLDGAAQAGMIAAAIGELPPLQRALLEGRFCPKTFPCECGLRCCRRWYYNPRYKHAFELVTELVGTVVPLTRPYYRLREGVIQKHFGETIRVVQIGEEYGIADSTVSKYSKLILDVVRPQDKAAMRAASDVLQAAGIVGEES